MEAAFEGLVNMLHKDSKDENDEVWLRSTTQRWETHIDLVHNGGKRETQKKEGKFEDKEEESVLLMEARLIWIRITERGRGGRLLQLWGDETLH